MSTSRETGKSLALGKEWSLNTPSEPAHRQVRAAPGSTGKPPSMPKSTRKRASQVGSFLYKTLQPSCSPHMTVDVSPVGVLIQEVDRACLLSYLPAYNKRGS